MSSTYGNQHCDSFILFFCNIVWSALLCFCQKLLIALWKRLNQAFGDWIRPYEAFLSLHTRLLSMIKILGKSPYKLLINPHGRRHLRHLIALESIPNLQQGEGL